MEIYLDYAATTPVDKDALEAAAPFFSDVFFNPSSAHVGGQRAAKAMENARAQCAAAIGAENNEIVFTSGGTEAINLAMSGIKSGSRVVVSAIEHDSVTGCAERLKSRGVEVVTVVPNRDGIITPEALEKDMTDGTALVCVMTVNNQTGAIQPVKELAEVAHRFGALFFTDAVQAVSCVDISVKNSCADMLAVSGHKFYAPKGVGFLYVKKGVAIKPEIVGGGQEKGLRAGTQNVPAIVAMGRAIEDAVNNRNENTKKIKEAENAFLKCLDFGRPVLVSDKAAGLISVVFDGIKGGRLAVALSMAGVYCSVGSACAAGSDTVPPALVAMCVENADHAVRFSFGKYTTAEQAAQAAKIVNNVVKNLKPNI